MTAEPETSAGVYAFPASRAQHQLYFVQAVNAADSTYHVPLRYRLDGPLDVAALRRAVSAVVARHEALRTTFTLEDGELLQVVDPDAELDLDVVVLDSDDAVELWARERASAPFDLERGPLVRAELARRSPLSATLLLTLHHIVCDGWSAAIVLDELVAAYAGHPLGDPPAFQYADFAHWQDEWLAGPGATAQLEHWRRALAGPLPVLRLAADPPGGEPGGATLTLPVPATDLVRLRAAAAAGAATPFMALLSAFAIALRARTGVLDVVVGAVAANRTRAEFDRTVGFFVNALPIRVDLAGEPTFRGVLAAVREATLSAHANQDLPFERVVEAVNPPRGDHHPVFQVLFTHNELDAPRVRGGLRCTPVLLDSDTAKFQLTLEVVESADGAEVNLEYRTDLLTAAQVAEFGALYLRVLARAAADPGAALAALAPLAPPAPIADDEPDWDESAPYAAPTTAVEAVLAGVWARVLGQDLVGIDDNYFEIGGDSIRSVQILARAKEHGVALALTDLIRCQTIRELAPLATAATAPDPAAAPFALLDPAQRERAAELGAVDAYPLSALQAGMLAHSESAARERIYHNLAWYDLRAEHDESAWEWAVRTLLSRHEVLRTGFVVDGPGEPLQLVHAELPSVPLSTQDLRGLDAAARERAFADRWRTERDRPFDWTAPPLIRFHLQRTGSDTARLWITDHHAIMDGWSARSLFAELLALYAHRLGRGRPVPAPPTARFRSFVALERAAEADPAQRGFWADWLRERPPARPRGSAEPDMAMTEHAVPGPVAAGLVALAARLRTPVRLVLLAAHLRVVAVLAGEADPVTGVVYNGRVEEADGDRVLGLFLNTLPFRAGRATGSWADLVRAVAAADLAVQPARRYPLARMLREHGGAELFDTFFNYTHFHVSRGRSADEADGEVVVLDEHSLVPTSFPLGAEFSREVDTDVLWLGLRHDRTRFDAAAVDRIRDYYLTALGALATDPDARCADTVLLGAGELGLLRAWNDTDRAYPGPHVLHHLVEARLRAAPTAEAVRFDGEVLTAAELDAWAGRVAAGLADRGVRPGDFVGVTMRRSLELVVGLLGVLKAGAAYAPIDPDNPPARNAAMVADAGIDVVLTEDAVRVDRESGRAPAPPVALTPAHPAYLIFTSGSTGRPKGVVVAHRAIANRLLWMQDAYPIDESDRVLQKTPYSFDVSVWEFFWPLLTGAPLVVARPGGHRDPAYLGALIRAERITVTHFVPSMLRAFLDPDAGGEPGSCTGLRRVFASGEALPLDLQRRFLDALDADLVNLYGPTEAAVDVSHWRCRDDGRDVVPIGRPIANLRLLVLDPDGNPAPIGVAGELFIEGAGVAEGYRNRPDLTAERFAGGRYRTGDLARHLPGGELEYLGRVDDQVKVRGFRVEPAEVEAALAEHPAVRESAVVLAGDALAVFVVAGAGVDQDALRAHLGSRLPAHMVPTAWQAVDALPLTPNGKVDRAALAARGVDRPARSATPPATDTERVLLALWQDLLGAGGVGVEDAFADLGGHSLLALRLMAAVRKEFGHRLSLPDLMTGGTVRSVAAAIDRAGAPAEDAPRLVTLRPGTGAPLVLIHPAAGEVLCYRALVGALRPGRAVHAVAAPEAPAADVRSLAEQYLPVLLAAVPRGPHHLAGWSFGGVVALELAVLLAERGIAVGTVTMIDPAFPGSQGFGPDDDPVELLRRDLRGTGAAAAEPTEGLLRVFRANLDAHERYRPPAYAGVVEFVEGAENQRQGAAGRWAAAVGARFTARPVPADHYALMRPPHVGAVADLLDRAMGAPR